MDANAEMRVLWVDDEPDTVEGVRATLEFEGHEVVLVEHLDGATERLRGERFDVVIVDEILGNTLDPSDLGSSLIEKLKAGHMGTLNAEIPFMFVTGNSSWVDLAAVEPLDGFLGVAHKAGELTGTIAELLGQLIVVPGLVGPDGNPLSSDAPAYDELEARLQSISELGIAAIAAEPHLMQQMHWRDYEKLIARLFAENGFDVTLTSPSGDHGADLYAARHTNLGTLLYVVECKRYKEGRPVGPGLVRELRGVVDRERATCGVLATTSYFTPGAYEEQMTSPYRIALRDLQQVARWVQGAPILD